MKPCVEYLTLSTFIVILSTNLSAEEYLSGINWEEPPVVTPADTCKAPSDAIVLFNGKNFSAWEGADNWKIVNGAMVVGGGEIKSKQAFGNCQLHIEWSAPIPVTGEGQGRGNSGIFLMDTYEIQVLDSYNNQTYFDGQAGAIYKQTPPMVNAMRPPGQWNVYNILFTAPRFNDNGSVESPAYMTALHNGVVILNHFELEGDTPFHRPPAYTQHEDKLPIRLQDHGNPVRFRNIWVREMKPATGERIQTPFLRNAAGEERPIE